MSLGRAPVLYVDRDGTLIAEPDDFQVDSYAKLRFVDGVIPALLRLRDAGYRLVMITTRAGLGGARCPRGDFGWPSALLPAVPLEDRRVIVRGSGWRHVTERSGGSPQSGRRRRLSSRIRCQDGGRHGDGRWTSRRPWPAFRRLWAWAG